MSYFLSIHRSAWRDCLKNSWRASGAYVLVSQGGQMGLVHPLVPTHRASIWSLPGIFKQSLSLGTSVNKCNRGPALLSLMAPFTLVGVDP
jgi:hypothetical protein